MDHLQEIRALMQKGTGAPPGKLFYLGIVIGIVMGPTLLVAATLPSVRESLDQANFRSMIWLGIGMTVMLGVTLVDEGVKAWKNRKRLNLLGEHPHRIAHIHRKSRGEKAQLEFGLYDRIFAHILLERRDAHRLHTLLANAALVFCPYCVTPISEATVMCPRCGQDVTRDAPIEMSLADYRVEEKKTCPYCDARMLAYAIRCPACGKKP
jgi:DNA-directed RNA polymerase subunit RPC12/RpoP